MGCRERRHAPREHTIGSINGQHTASPGSNKAITAKYRWWSFLPLFLYDQYTQFENIYYLLNAIAGYIVVLIEPIANVLPIIFVLIVAAIRELIEDAARHSADRQTNNRLYTVVRNKEYMDIHAQDICRGDILVLHDKKECPCDCVLLRSTNESGVSYISTSSLDGETALKPKYELLFSEEMADITQREYEFEADPPSTRMGEFNGYLGGHCFTIENAMLRGVKLENTEQALLAVVYTGRDAKIMANKQKLKMKSSQMGQRMYGLVICQVLLSVIISVVLPFVSSGTTKRYHHEHFTFILEPSTFWANFLNKFIVYFILLAYFIPVSLFVTMELARMVSSMEVDCDYKLRDARFTEWLRTRKKGEKLQDSPFSDMNSYELACQAKNIVSVENLEELDIIFADKTGTLTKNEMTLHSCVDSHGAIFKYGGTYDDGIDKALLYGLALCNTVIYEPESGEYQGESPDEVAFATASRTLGLQLLERRNNEIIYGYLPEKADTCATERVEYEKLGLIPFSSDRKCMSICLREVGVCYQGLEEQDRLIESGACVMADGRLFFTPQRICGAGVPFLLAKGADSVMADKITQPHFGNVSINGILGHFSGQGLRILVFAARQLSGEDITLLNSLNTTAYNDADNEKIKVLESGLQTLGASAVEDKLQDDVPETLEALMDAGIRIWMLTGDMVETAVSIGRSSGLVRPESRPLYLTRSKYENSDELRGLIQTYLDIERQLLTSRREEATFDAQLRELLAGKAKMRRCPALSCRFLDKENSPIPEVEVTLVLDGYTFDQLTRHGLAPELCHLACYSSSAICCRLLPNQKAEIVNLSHHWLGFNTMAVGDGANDVMMIKEAKTGIGIAGKEGMHACNSADITMPEFKFLRRLVLCYGRVMHLRIEELFEYVVEKNCIISTMHIVYSFYNLFTVETIVDSLLLLLFNTLTTLYPILFESITEIDVRLELLEKHPRLYYYESLKYRPNARYFVLRLVRETYYSVIMIVVSRYMNADGIIFAGGKINDINSESYSQYIILLFVSSIEFILHQSFYSYFTLAAFLLMIAVTTLASWFGNFFDLFGTTLLSVPAEVTLQLSFHIRYFVVTLICVVPSILYTAIRKLYFPGLGDVYRYQDRYHRGECINPRNDYSSGPASEKVTVMSPMARHESLTAIKTVRRQANSRGTLERME